MTKKQKILKEAAKLFAEKGFNETPTSEIAEAAGAAHGTVFYHFASKKDILKDIFINLVDTYYAAVCDAVKEEETGLENLLKILEATFAYLDESKAEHTVLFRDMPLQMNSDKELCKYVSWNNTRNIQIIQTAIEKGIKDGSVNSSVDAASDAIIIRAMIIGTIRIRLKEPSLFRSPTEQVQNFCRNALANRGEK